MKGRLVMGLKWFLGGLLCCLWLPLSGCENLFSKRDSSETQARQVVSLGVELQRGDNGYVLTMDEVPAGSSLECFLNEQLTTPCANGAVLHLAPGATYTLMVRVSDAKGLLAEGTATVTAEILRPAATEATLAVRIDSPGFTSGMTLEAGSTYALSYSLPNDPRCEEGVKFQHSLDKDEGTVPLTTAALSIQVPIALGRQEHKVQARCGDVLGAPLRVHWYGVPKGYQPLAVQLIRGDVTLVRLVKEDDCPNAKTAFECTLPEGDAFASSHCPLQGQTLVGEVKGIKIRARCGEQVGEPQSLD